MTAVNPLNRLLIEKGILDLAESKQYGDAPPRGLASRLLAEGRVSADELAQILSELLRIPYVTLSDVTVTAELFAVLPARTAYRLGVIPMAFDDGVLTVALSDPFDPELIEILEQETGCTVKPVIAPMEAIRDVLRRSQGSDAVLQDLSRAFRPVVDEAAAAEPAADGVDEAAGPVAQLLHSILVTALQKRASDIHIETFEHGVAVKNRIDGVLYDATERLDRGHHSGLMTRLKVMAGLDIAEKRIPQDGRFSLSIGGRDIDFRVSILPGVYGEDAVIRVLDKAAITRGVDALTLDHLGIEAAVLKKFRKAIREPYGMVLITGPTGSGKTTSLYAAINELHTGEEKIITVEDPVEYQLDGVVQIAVNEKKGLTFARGLRSILRHDPDKIMVGEIRDTETMEIAAQAALTGHLVFTTIHANNVFDVLGRFAHMSVDLHSFISALNCVMAQRLVRLVCPQCRQSVQPDPALLEESGLTGDRYKKASWVEARGCPACQQTGYSGRAAISEFLDLTPRIRDLIVARAPISTVQAAAIEEGMQTLREAAIARAVAGETTLREINRVTFVD